MGALAVNSFKDASGGIVTGGLRMWDESGSGAGPWSTAPVNLGLVASAAPDYSAVAGATRPWSMTFGGALRTADAALLAQLILTDAKIPATLGTKASAASLSVALSTEDKGLLDGLEGFVDGLETVLADVLAALNVDSSAFLEALLGATNEGAPTTVATATGLRGVLRSLDAAARYTLTDASITSATGSTQQLLAAADRRRILIHNCATTAWWINPSGGNAVAASSGSFELVPGASWTPGGIANAIQGIGVTASKLTVVSG